jgi:hypothetical protein
MPSTVHAAQPANHSHAVLRIFSRMRDVRPTGKREMAGQLDFLRPPDGSSAWKA